MRSLLRSTIFCFCTCIAIAVFAFLVLARARDLRAANARVDAWRDVELTSERVLGALRDAETGQRGYLLTQQPEYLAPFDAARREVGALTASLESQTLSLPTQFEAARRIGALSRLKLEELSSTIELARAGKTAEALAVVRTNQGRDLMDQMRSLSDAIGRAATANVQSSQLRVAAATRNLALSVISTSALSILLLVLLGYFLRRDGRALHDLAEQLTITLRSIGDAVVATDGDGNVTYLNPIAAEISQRTLPATPTRFRDLFKLVNEVTGAEAVNPIEHVLRDGKTIGLANHTALLRPDGTSVSIEDSAAPLRDDAGNVRGVVFVFKDISERRSADKQLESARLQLEQSVRDLQASEAQLLEADRRKDEFLATLAHELRNPVAPIKNAITLLERDDLPMDRRQHMRSVIRRQVAHVARLLDDLLDSARITRGELALQLAATPLATIVADAIEVARPLVERKAHKLEVRLPAAPLTLMVDEIRMAQVLSNLLTNAAKYTDPGGTITLDVALNMAPDVAPGDNAAGARELTLAVTDSGVGLAPPAMVHIFDMFSQVRSSRGRSEGGLGIGLSLAHHLTALHGGRLLAESAGEGQGSTFTIALPAAVIVPQSAAAAPLQPAAQGGSRRVVLVIDDNVDAAASLAVLLEMAGHKVLTAYCGLDGVELAREHRPAVIIVDIGLPDIDGHQVAREVRAELWGKDPLVIALTGWGQASDKALAKAAGFDLHLTKPADVDQLLQLVAMGA